MDISRRHSAPFLAAALVLFCLCGCEDRKSGTPPPAPPPRTQDPAYLKQLDEGRQALKAPARESNRVKAELAAVVASARANLPQGATDEQIRAELDGHPEKYPKWKDLVSANEAANAAIEKRLEENRKIVRARILKEMAEQKTDSAAKR
ncbi:MAG: hypothetical protein ACI4Q3_09285 [Kiritimatiellia bacterium]